MSDLAPLTLVIGPQTAMALSLNALVRTLRVRLRQAGLIALPSRVASPLLRRNLDPHLNISDRKADLAAQVATGPALLSAVSFLGAPQAGLHQGELFPDAEKALAGLGALVGPARVVLVVDSLPAFFLAAGSDVLEARVRRHDWETLYELGWADLAREIVAAVPECELLILSPRGAAVRSPETLERLFGPAASAVQNPYVFLKGAISETGVAVLNRTLEETTPDAAMLGDLYDSFAGRPDPTLVAERLGIDKLTMTLLDQRLAEDLEAIASLPGAEVI